MPTNRLILLVEDNEDDVFLMKRALDQAEVRNPLQVVDTGQAAIDYLEGAGPYADRDRFPLPVVVFLDLKLPLKSGHEVLAWMRRQERFETTVVVVLTSSDETSDVTKAYRLGANSYLIKPPSAQDLTDMAKAFKWYWLEYNQFEPV